MRMQRTQFVTVGPVPPELSALYVNRPADNDFDVYLEQDRYIGVLGPRFIGKTNLMTRKYNQLRERPGYATVYLFMSRFEQLTGASWYENVHRHLMDGLGARPDTLARHPLELRDQIHRFLRDDPAKRKLVIFLDDVEKIPKPLLQPTMLMIREIFNSRGVDDYLKRCTFVLGGCFLPDDLIKNPDFSPFWVAELIYLTDADRDGVAQLVNLLARPDREIRRDVADRVFEWTQGDLYLTQCLCQLLDREPSITPSVVDRLVNDELTRAQIFSRLLRNIEENFHLRNVLKHVARGSAVRFNRLQRPIAEGWRVGLIKENAAGFCALRNEVYRQVLKRNDLLPTQEIPTEQAKTEPAGRKVLHGRYILENGDGRHHALHDEGGQAQIYRAIDMVDNREVAIKRLDAELARNPEHVERFTREGEALRQLDHPNIVHFIDSFQEQDALYIVMEFVPGGNLRKYAHRSGATLPLADFVRIMRGVALGLEYIHTKEIVHRDIKPENILLMPDLTPRLADFGIVRLPSRPNITRGALIGTLAYLPPEAFRDEPVTPLWDLWSLGVIMFEMLARFRPFRGDSYVQDGNHAQLMHAILEDPIPHLHRLNADLPEDLCDIVARLMTRDLSARMPSARALVDALEGLGVL